VAGKEFGKAKLEDDGGLATRRACSKCHFPTGNDRRDVHYHSLSIGYYPHDGDQHVSTSGWLEKAPRYSFDTLALQIKLLRIGQNLIKDH